jgi:hypothetical protein
MSVIHDRTVTIVDAARLIFRTSAPDDRQVHRVYELMKVGAIRVRDCGGSPLRWTTTEGALADFLTSQREARMKVQRSSQRLRKPNAGLGDEHPLAALHEDDEESDKLRGVYRNIWRDYFLAVMLRRRVGHRTHLFARWVVVGQVVVLLTLIGTFAGVVRLTWNPKPAEHAAIECWIAENTDDFGVTRWFPFEEVADVAGTVVRVQYRYQKESRRWIHTDRRFQVLGDTVTELPGE